jgi:6-phosphogluconolactonase (cycloisomerase 2 family)
MRNRRAVLGVISVVILLSWLSVGVFGATTPRFVANGQAFGTTSVTAYSISASSGELTSLGTPLAGGTAPWDITTDVTGKYVYMTNNDSTISGYAIDNTTGELSVLKGSPFAASVSTRGIAADPSGKYLYLSNGEQLLGYAISATSGALSQLTTSPYSAGGDPMGLFVAGTIKSG